MAKMNKAGLKQHVSSLIQSANPEGALEARYDDAMNMYWGRMPANKPGRSQIVSTDIADMTEATLAQLMPSFSNDQLGTFEPLSEEDVKQSEEESVAVNHVIMEQNNGYMMFNSAIKNACIKKNAWIRAELVTKVDIDTKHYDGLTAEALRQLIEPIPERNGVRIETVYTNVETEGELTSLTAKTTVTTESLEVESIDPAYMVVTAAYDKHDMKDCPLVGELDYMTRSDLIERAFDKDTVNKLTHVESMGHSSTASGYSQPAGGSDPATDLIEVYRLFVKVDYDGDGIAERREIWLGGGVNGEILKNDPVNVVPYATGVIFTMPNTWQGVSMVEKLGEEQKVKTATMRNWVDNNKVATYGRFIVQEDQVQYGDIMNAVPGGLIRAKNVDAVKPLATIDIGASAASLMQYVDKMRTEKGGASLDMQGAEQQIVGETARGIERQFSSKEQLCEMMSQNLAETLLKHTFLLVHRQLRESSNAPLIIKRGDEWLSTTPDQWEARDRVNVTLGASLNARERLMTNIEKMINFAFMMKQTGIGTIFQDEQGMYQAIKDWGYSANLNNPDSYWIDPSSTRGKQKAKQAAEQAKQRQQAQAQMQQVMMQMQQQIEQNKLASEEGMHTADTRFKYFDAWLSAEIEEAKLVGQSTLQLELAQQQARAMNNGNQNESAVRGRVN